MIEFNDFNYERFLLLKGHALHNYVEPFVNMQVEQLRKDFPSYEFTVEFGK